MRGPPPKVAQLAQELRMWDHRTRDGRLLPMSWVDIADELARQGQGRWRPEAVAAAVRGLAPLQVPPPEARGWPM